MSIRRAAGSGSTRQRWIVLQLVLFSCAGQDVSSDHTSVRAGLDGGEALQAQASDAGQPTLDASGDGSAAESADATSGSEPEPEQPSMDLVALLHEIERGTLATCPCRVEAGQYKSLQECLDDVRFEAGWEDCAERVPVPNGNAEILHCSVDALRRRTDCLDTAPCATERLAFCRNETAVCPTLDAEVLNRVLVWCRGMIILFH